MSEFEAQALHTEGVLSDYFAIEGHILSTRSADAYKAIDKSRTEPVCLWMLKHPLAVGSEAVRRFLGRMDIINRIDPKVTEMTAYGVDAEGTAFSVFPNLNGQEIVTGNIETKEGERRFLAAIQIIGQLHNQGVVCGDLCGSSFWIDRAGEVSFIGPMGSFDSEAVSTMMLPPASTIPYLAPEQRGGGGIQAATDVFALGILGYHLLTGHYPYGQGADLMAAHFDPRQVRPLTDYVGIPPVWAESILIKAIDPNPEIRFTNARAMYDAVIAVRQRAFEEDKVPMVSRPLSGQMVGGETETDFSPVVQEEAEVPSHTVKRISQRAKILVLAFLIVLLFLLVIADKIVTGKRSGQRAGEDQILAPLGDAGNPDIGRAIKEISKGDVPDSARSDQIKKLSESNDPVAHYTLVKIAKEADSKSVQVMAEKGILNRARRLGLIRSAEQVRGWLRNVHGQNNYSGYEEVLRVLDTSLPMQERSDYLRRAYRDNPDFIIRLTAALGFDSNSFEEYQEVLAQLVGDAQDGEDLSRYSFLAVVLAYNPLSIVFSDDIVQNREKLTDVDILWVLRMLADRNDINTRSISNLALERGILAPQKRIFVRLVRDRGNLPPDVLSSLVKAAGGALTLEDLGSFGRWIDMESEKILLAVLADTKEKKLLQEAFDLVAGKSLTIEPSASLIKWVKVNYWDERAEFAHAIGVLAFLDSMEAERIVDAFNAFDAFVRDSNLIDILIKTDNAVILRLVLDKYSDLIDDFTKVNLLQFKDQEVKIKACKSISTNDVGLLKMVLDAYKLERDPEVKKCYNRFWVVQELQREKVDSAGG
jgi:hypothetical protein